VKCTGWVRNIINTINRTLHIRKQGKWKGGRYREDKEIGDKVQKSKISMLHKTGRDVSVLVSGGGGKLRNRLLGAFA